MSQIEGGYTLYTITNKYEEKEVFLADNIYITTSDVMDLGR